MCNLSGNNPELMQIIDQFVAAQESQENGKQAPADLNL